MPTTTQEHMESQELVFPAGGDRREPEGRPEWTGGGASVVDPSSLSPELVDEAVDRAGGRRRVRQALGMPSDRRISDEVIDELLAGASGEEEIAGPGGLLAELTKRLVERAMSTIIGIPQLRSREFPTLAGVVEAVRVAVSRRARWPRMR